MTQLAIHGGEPEVKGVIRPFNRIGPSETTCVMNALGRGPLSGFLGGELRGGYWVQDLEEQMAALMGVKHAVACNSATSGLLAACVAAGVGPRDQVIVPSFTMSATAAAPAHLGADLTFGDIDPTWFCLDTPIPVRDDCKAVIVTNLFGHPARLNMWREIADTNNAVLIEDNAQAPFAQERERFTGTVGHIGVFSFNVHKHIQAGEGGVCVTDDDGLADEMRRFINHGEMAGGRPGLNLRMTEITAAIACAQLARAHEIIAEREALAEGMTEMLRGAPGLTVPTVRDGCRHVYYIWALKVVGMRDKFVEMMNAEGVPLRKGYVDPLYRLPTFSTRFPARCPMAERMQDERLTLFEVCAHDPTREQQQQICNAFKKVAEHLYT